MCMFGGGPMEIPLKVGGTNLYAAPDGDGQFLVYSLNLTASEPVAMVLPLPVPPNPTEDAVAFLDLSGYPDFFRDINDAFPPMIIPAARGLGGGRSASSISTLKVHQTGDFESSFVPTLADFERLDPRFRIASAVWDGLPQYADWAFAVFQLTTTKGTGWRRLLGGHPKPNTIPAMAMRFPRRFPDQLFFPTVHVHDGELHEHAEFDHSLFWQTTKATTPASIPPHELSEPARETVDVERTLGMVHGDLRFRRMDLRGTFANRDHWIVEE